MTTADKARGKWRGIMIALGMDAKFLTKKHGACPFCEGRDRYRWDDKGGNGNFICSQCGAGTGFDLLMRFKGWDFRTAAAEVDKIVSTVKAQPIPQEPDAVSRRQALNGLWQSGRPICASDHAYAYLESRVTLPDLMPSCLRFVAKAREPDGTYHPTMIALVHGADGVPVSLHRTFLGAKGKADIAKPRALMPGNHPDGSAVRLFPVKGACLGIAEGIETALAAAARFNVPVWAALTANALSKWVPPSGVDHVLVFGDCDASFTGQAAAYSLARRLTTQFRVKVDVHIPQTIGRDWADSDAA